MLKIVLLISIFVSSGFLGFQTSNVFKEKTQFYQDLLDFIKNIKTEISFLKTDIISIFSKYNFSSKFQNVKNHIQTLYTSNRQIQIEEIKEIISKNIQIEEVEQNTISQMFFDFGQLDYINQLEQIDYYKNQFEIMLTKSSNRADKMMPLCKKMGILIGFLVCIVLI